MNTFEVILTKSYLVTVNANTDKQARNIAEFYTSDIKDISVDQDRKKYKFSIGKIDCRVNEALEAIVLKK